MANEKIIDAKKAEVKALAEKMKEAKLVLFTDYRGISVTDVTDLRTKVRNANGEYKVIKNNITRRALQECKFEGLDDALVGPTAVIMTNDDYLEPTKAIYEYAKSNENYKIKGGIIEGKVMTAEEIITQFPSWAKRKDITIAKLPSRETLLSMLAGALLGNISKLAVALGEVQKQKEQA